METQSAELNELIPALAKAQAAIEPAVKDTTNPHFKWKYADLASIVESCRKPLADNGLARVQLAECGDGFVCVTTKIIHASGQWVGMSINMPVAQATPQGVGSAITYGRRYGLACLVGIVADEDDDGLAASGVTSEQPQRQRGGWSRNVEPPVPAPAPTATPSGDAVVEVPEERLMAGFAKLSELDQSGAKAVRDMAVRYGAAADEPWKGLMPARSQEVFAELVRRVKAAEVARG